MQALVEVDVGLDEAGRHQAAFQIEHRRGRINVRGNFGDAPVGDADVETRAVTAGVDRATQDLVQWSSPLPT